VNSALLSLALPFATALLLMLIHGFRLPQWLGGPLIVVASALSLAAALAAMGSGTGASELLEMGGWPAPLAIRLQLTPLKALLLVFAALLHLLVGLYALTSQPAVPPMFWPLSAILHSAFASLILCVDAFSLYISLELLSLTAVALVATAGPKAYAVALDYLLLSLAASLCYLMGVAVLYSHYGILDFLLIGELAEADISTRVALLLMTVGLMVKGALWPLHFWLPPAHTNAPTPVSALLSGLVVKGPLFILWQLWSQVAPAEMAREVGPLFALGGAFALISGGWSALRAAYVKTVVAYSTVAQLGYAMMGLGLLLFWQQPQYHVALWLFVVAHGLAKVSMFLSAGEMQATLGSRRISSLRGATQTVPAAMSAFAIAGVSLIGLPPTGGFLAKWVLLGPIFTEAEHWPWAFVVLLGTVVTAAYVFRAIGLGFYQASSNRPPYNFNRPAQLLALLPALLVLSMVLIGEELIQWLEGVTG
jgi:multicomponent Na+:H+ antiporter subunit D